MSDPAPHPGTTEVPLTEADMLRIVALHVAIAGGQSAFARCHGVPKSTVANWLTLRRVVPGHILARLGMRRESRLLLTVPE